MRISDWSSDVCSSDLAAHLLQQGGAVGRLPQAVNGEIGVERLHDVRHHRADHNEFRLHACYLQLLELPRARHRRRRFSAARADYLTAPSFFVGQRCPSIANMGGTAKLARADGGSRISHPRSSAERGVGKEWVGTGKYRWLRDH